MHLVLNAFIIIYFATPIKIMQKSKYTNHQKLKIKENMKTIKHIDYLQFLQHSSTKQKITETSIQKVSSASKLNKVQSETLQPLPINTRRQNLKTEHSPKIFEELVNSNRQSTSLGKSLFKLTKTLLISKTNTNSNRKKSCKIINSQENEQNNFKNLEMMEIRKQKLLPGFLEKKISEKNREEMLKVNIFAPEKFPTQKQYQRETQKLKRQNLLLKQEIILYKKIIANKSSCKIQPDHVTCISCSSNLLPIASNQNIRRSHNQISNQVRFAQRQKINQMKQLLQKLTIKNRYLQQFENNYIKAKEMICLLQNKIKLLTNQKEALEKKLKCNQLVMVRSQQKWKQQLEQVNKTIENYKILFHKPLKKDKIGLNCSQETLQSKEEDLDY